MTKKPPDPDMGAPGTQSHVASNTDFTGVVANLGSPDPFLEAHLTKRMKNDKQGSLGNNS